MDSGLEHESGSFESFPLTRLEYISAMVDFYRGEMYRSQIWRMRLVTTTGWAVVTVAGLITFAFSSPGRSSFTLLLADVLITNFLAIEAGCFRFFSVYRARVRMLEKNFYLPLIHRDLTSATTGWRELLAKDLDEPKFKNTFTEALMFRLRRNYVSLYGIVLVTWIVKLFIHPTPAAHLSEMFARMGIGPIPPWVVLAMVILFHIAVVLPLFTRHGQRRGRMRQKELSRS